MFKKLLFVLLLLVLLIEVGIRFAEPVGDGDLFWQMAYGRYLVEHKTLVPDHSLFSFTPATNDTIYCSWVAEIIFYLLYSVAGLPLLFAFRYLCILVCLWLYFDFQGRLAGGDPEKGLSSRVETFLYAVVMLLAGYVGTILKPELFSLVFFYFLAWGYFTFRVQAQEGGGLGRRWLFYFPLLMLVWVNTHGVFMFGLLALLALCLGEWLNLLVARGLALPAPLLRQFSLSTLLSVLACFCTPYGYRYPLQLARELQGLLTGTQPLADAIAYASLAAHQKITTVPGFNFVPLMLFMVACLLWYWVLQARSAPPGRRLNAAVILVNLLLGALYFWYLRTTYYWAPFWGFTCLYGLDAVSRGSARGAGWMRERLMGSWLSGIAFVAICAYSCWQSIVIPYAGSWCGFGISYFNPVLEAEWVQRFTPQARIYNDYDGGGYLLWRLYPETKVMVDPRSFPYRDWFQDYARLEAGEIYHEFVDGFDRADVAIISHKNQAMWRRFLQSGEWVPIWIGPSSIVLGRPQMKYPAGAAEFAPERFRQVKNFYQAYQIFTLCMEVGQYDAGFATLRAMATNFGSLPEEKEAIEAFALYKDALVAENAELNFDKALLLYEECRRRGIFYSDQKLMEMYKIRLKRLTNEFDNKKNAAALRDLAVRMSALARGEAPPMPLKERKLVGEPTAVPSP